MASEQAAVTKSKEEVDKVGENLEVTDNENIQDKPSLKDKLVKAYKFLIRNQGTISDWFQKGYSLSSPCGPTVLIQHRHSPDI